MGRRIDRRRAGVVLTAGLLGVALAMFVAAARASHGANVFSGQWLTVTATASGTVTFAVVDAATAGPALTAAGGTPCSDPTTVYYSGAYAVGSRTGSVIGCTAGGPNHLVGRYVGDPKTDPRSLGDIDIVLTSPGAFSGTQTAVAGNGPVAYAGAFQSHLTGDGCCPAGPPPITTTTMTTNPPPPGGVLAPDVDPIFPFPGLTFSGRVGGFLSSFDGSPYTATIAWGDGTPTSPGVVSPPVRTAQGFDWSITGTHTYARIGSYPVTVTVSDARGATQSAANLATVSRCLCATRPPIFARTADVGPAGGQVFVKLATAGRRSRFVRLTGPREIPVGSQVDTRRGRVVVHTAAPGSASLNAGLFSGGVFVLLQNRREHGVTELRLLSTIPARGCSVSSRARTAAARRLSSRVLGLLRHSVKGRFRTRGRFASATVRGTQWTTSDRCDGTLTAVARGSVTVFDLRLRRSLVVSAGHSYLARAR